MNEIRKNVRKKTRQDESIYIIISLAENMIKDVDKNGYIDEENLSRYKERFSFLCEYCTDLHTTEDINKKHYKGW